ncbi:hypothetical protein [uncultured Lawsonella sp.]|uniref:hypothetical protein n=1 Tax=uncultured Lawsonella sp. TaxID=1847727 RepID=UPI00262CC47C|nr:hypothetical protein [uncultured Lawsonella sp.]
MSELEYTPVILEKKLRDTLNEIMRAPKICERALAEYRAAGRAYDEKYHTEKANFQGTIPDKESHAVLSSMAEREAMETAEVAYKYARDRKNAVELCLGGLQSISRSVQQAYNAIGMVEP